jgi:hypothetical protein
MDEPLAIYLHDHLAGAEYAIDLTGALGDHYEGKALGDFADSLLREITQDRDTLRLIADQIGKPSGGIKEAAAWLSEKISRLKLDHSDSTGLGTFEALEFLQLGIHGKLALWLVLGELSGEDQRLKGYDFDELASRAQHQEKLVEERRFICARSSFLNSSEAARWNQPRKIPAR